MKRILWILFSLALFGTTASFALPFNIVPAAPLPTKIMDGQSLMAVYKVTNNTGETRQNNFIKYLPPHVTQVTSDPTYSNLCGKTFNLGAHGKSNDTCILALSITGGVNANDPDPHHHLFACFPGGTTCAGTYQPLNISKAPTLVYTRAYISALDSNSVFLCSINASGKLFNCRDSGVGSTPFDGPTFMSFNKTGTEVYVGNLGNPPGSATGVTRCSVNPSTGSFIACQDAGVGAIFQSPIGVALNSANTRLYVANLLNEVEFCSVNPNGAISNCVPTGGNGFSLPTAIVLNAAESRAYITNQGTNSVSLCMLNSASGVLSSCGNSGGTDFFSPVDSSITLNKAGSHVYVSNNGMGAGTTVTLCTINLINGTLNNCSGSGVGSAFQAPAGVMVNSNDTLLYVVNNVPAPNGFVSLCAINPTTRKLTSCQNAGADATASFGRPGGIVLR